MKIISNGQITESEAFGLPFDVFLGACGYEERSRFAAGKVMLSDQADKIVFPFRDRHCLDWSNNIEFFKDQKFSMEVEGRGSDGRPLAAKLVESLNKCSGKVSRVAIDYSSMTRAWYGALVKALAVLSERVERVEVVFIYSPSEFVRPSYNPARNTLAGPVEGFCHLQPGQESTALVVGLGYERGRASGLHSYLDPDRTSLFLTDPALDPRFPPLVRVNNSEIIAEAGGENIFMHPVSDLDLTAALLYDVVVDLRRTHKVIIAPLGVKPFSLLSMLMVARYRFADVWRVTGAENSEPSPRKPLGQCLCYEVVFGLGKASE